MKKANIAMVIIGLIVILFVAFCPLAESKNMAWRISIGLVGCFSVVSGAYKIVCKNKNQNS
ncbi:MAG: hypothetical protein K2O40_08625 [Lachnospiraceae bacterium]|nr:hypothetical protein [Lachnospiraceae bacterium]